MSALSFQSVSVSRGGRLLLDEVDLTVGPGQRIGLTGPNGAGKSTLLAVGAGLVPLDSGHVRVTPASTTVGLLRQQPERSDTIARDHLSLVTGVQEAERELEEATAAVAATPEDPAVAERYDRALQRWLDLGGADLDARLGRLVDELGLPERLLEQPLDTLSGGQRARVGLAGLLASRHDVVLVDEPTNDLDLDGLDRLEAWLVGRSGGAVVVSHDREFLRRTVTDVAEVDPHHRSVVLYRGGWDAYQEERRRAAERAQERYEVYDRQRNDLAQRAQRQREWAQQGRAKVRRSGETDKFIRAFKVNQTEQLAGKAAQTKRAQERLEEVEKPWEPWELRLDIPDAPRSGDVVARLVGATVRRGGFTLGPVDLLVSYGDRLGLAGPNGAGKTTLLRLLLGELEPSSGRVDLGSGVIVGELGQTREAFVGDRPALERFVERTGSDTGEARTLLAKFGLFGPHLDRPADSLSPGERTRLVLAAFMAVGANLLVLDEPTNHLDLPAIEQLEQALSTFAGTVVVVSHDRAFLESLQLDRRLDVDDGTVTERR